MRSVLIFALGFVAGAGCLHLYERHTAGRGGEEAWEAKVDSLFDAFVGGESLEMEEYEDDDITFLETAGECVTDMDRLEVYRVLDSGNAIAFAGVLQVVLLRKRGELLYSGQIVKIPRGYCARQVGVYRPSSYRTYPVVKIDKK